MVGTNCGRMENNMSLNVYQFVDEIVNEKYNIWIRGDSDTGGTGAGSTGTRVPRCAPRMPP